MAYESLYRRYRPQRFSEVRGQDHVVTALHNAVRENRVGHAYLLSGPRGTGKTTTARILAKALNCTGLDDGEPCGRCDSCVAIEAGTSYDLQELDAASNNGVDAMRDLIAKAALGSPGRTKVYLLDEVHMLSTGASNALLKTLEEPPGHVVFVLATTDPHKVLPTIRSRTQHYELHLLAADELRALVDDVVADAGLDVDEDGIEYALRAGGGSARDTLSALDQVVAAGGVLDRGDQVEGLVDALAAGDTGTALRAVSDATGRGHDPRIVGEALLARIRDVFLHRMGDPLEHASAADRTRTQTWAESFSDRACTRILEEVGDALRDMRTAPDTRIPLEVALVRITRAGSDTSLEQLAERVARLERGAAPAVAPTAGGTAGADRSGAGAAGPRPATAAGTGRPADAARAALGKRTEAGGTGAPATPDSSRPATGQSEATATPDTTAAPTGSDTPRPPTERTGTAPTSDPARPAAPKPPDHHDSSAPPSPPSLPAEPPAPPAEPPTPPVSPADHAERPPADVDAPAPAPPTAPPPPTAEPGPIDEPAPVGEPTAPPPTVPEPAPAGEPAAEAEPASSGAPSVAELEHIWTERVLPSLSGLTKAMFSVGHFVDTDGATARFAVPNEVHREKSLQKLGEVEAAIANHAGRTVKLDLIVEGAGSTPRTSRPGGRGRPAAGELDEPPAVPEPAQTDERDEIGPVDELVDAPADDRSATQRVIDAFPGAEIIDD